ncbi:MAG: hypothetical protein ACR2F8_07220, partial [Caulobacteraceae bacterium]
MKAKILIAGVTVAALAAGGASAATHKKHHKMHHKGHMAASSSSMYAEPAQPIPYTQLDAYMKASPRERQSMNMLSGAMAQPSDNGGAAPSDNSGAMAPAAPAPEAAPPPAA